MENLNPNYKGNKSLLSRVKSTITNLHIPSPLHRSNKTDNIDGKRNALRKARARRSMNMSPELTDRRSLLHPPEPPVLDLKKSRQSRQSRSMLGPNQASRDTFNDDLNAAGASVVPNTGNRNSTRPQSGNMADIEDYPVQTPASVFDPPDMHHSSIVSTGPNVSFDVHGRSLYTNNSVLKTEGDDDPNSFANLVNAGHARLLAEQQSKVRSRSPSPYPRDSKNHSDKNTRGEREKGSSSTTLTPATISRHSDSHIGNTTPNRNSALVPGFEERRRFAAQYIDPDTLIDDVTPRTPLNKIDNNRRHSSSAPAGREYEHMPPFSFRSMTRFSSPRHRGERYTIIPPGEEDDDLDEVNAGEEPEGSPHGAGTLRRSSGVVNLRRSQSLGSSMLDVQPGAVVEGGNRNNMVDASTSTEGLEGTSEVARQVEMTVLPGARVINIPARVRKGVENK